MFDEHDFLHELSRDGERSRAGREFIEGLKKTADVQGLATAVGQQIKAHAPEIAAALTGAALAGVGQFIANKPKKDGSPSLQQRAARAQVEETAKGPKDYHGRMSHAKAKAMSEMSDIMADHPVRGALTAVPAGATAGLTVAALAKKLRNFK